MFIKSTAISLISFLPLLSVPVRGSVPALPMHLQPVGENAGPAGAPDWIRIYKFGTVSALDGPHLITHDFTLRNSTNKPVTLVKLQASCGCTSAVVAANGKAKPIKLNAAPSANVAPSANAVMDPVTVAVGADVKVHVSIDRSHLAPGIVDKAVSVFVAGQDDPAAILEMDGQLDGGVVFAPNTLDFGNVRAGQPATLTLVMTPSDMSGRMPELVSSDGQVSIRPLSAVTADGPRRRFNVTVQKGHMLGPIMSELYVKSNPPGSTAFPGVTVPIRGTVVGTLSAQPAVAAFTMVTQDKGDAIKIVLTGTDPKSFAGIKCSSAFKPISARVVPAKHPALNKETLEVAVAPGTSAGSINTQLFVTNKAGEQLSIPVYAYVVGK